MKQESRFPPEGMPDLPDPLIDGDQEHLSAALEFKTPLTNEIRGGLFLMRVALVDAHRPWDLTGLNDFACIACFARAYRQLRAATLLAHFGYYSEVPNALRGAVESASLGRYLAREPDKAEKWLDKEGWIPQKKMGWIPDREVREWFGDTDEKVYATQYRFLSQRSHPTAAACLPLLKVDEDAYTVMFASNFDEQAFEDSLISILGLTMWACFALRNAAPDERAIRPDWRHALADYARGAAEVFEQKTGVQWHTSHLERNLNEEYEAWGKVIGYIPSPEEFEELLKNDPASWQNLRDIMGG